MSEESRGDSQATVKDRVDHAIQELRPYLQQHGGDIELAGVENDKIVNVRLQGACQGCHMAMQTLKDGVERYVREKVPEIERVEAEGLTH